MYTLDYWNWNYGIIVIYVYSHPDYKTDSLRLCKSYVMSFFLKMESVYHCLVYIMHCILNSIRWIVYDEYYPLNILFNEYVRLNICLLSFSVYGSLWDSKFESTLGRSSDQSRIIHFKELYSKIKQKKIIYIFFFKTCQYR